MKFILPKILAVITRHDRYIPEIKWSSKSWVHNIFRFYELIFGRRYGIRAEMSSSPIIKNGIVIGTNYQCYSVEAFFALIETYIRQWLKTRIWVDIKILELATPTFGFASIPWINFSIALDTSTIGTASTTSPLTWPHTCTGSNLALILSYAVWDTGSAASANGSSYNSVSTTQEKIQGYAVGKGNASVDLLLGPSTGSNTASISFSGGGTIHANGIGLSWSGVAQSGQPDATNSSNPNGTTTPSLSLTTIANNCWVMGLCAPGTVVTSITAGLTNRQSGIYETSTSTVLEVQDTNGPKTPAGSQTVNWTMSNSPSTGIIAMSLAPAASTVVTHLLSSTGVGG